MSSRKAEIIKNLTDLAQVNIIQHTIRQRFLMTIRDAATESMEDYLQTISIMNICWPSPGRNIASGIASNSGGRFTCGRLHDISHNMKRR